VPAIRVGILGGGNISDTHARAAQAIPGVEVVAVYGQNGTKTATIAAACGCSAYDDLDRFLSHRPMDLVAIGSPSGLHGEHGMRAAERGLHVLVEKPIEISTARADTLIEVADRAGVKLGVFFQDRLKPAAVRMKALVEAGRLGTPILASARVKWYRPPEYYSGSRWRGTRALDGGGAIINQAIHTVDLLEWMMGRVRSVEARIATRLHAIEVEDTAAAVFEFESGALGTLEATTSVFPGYARRLEISGSNGTLILDHDRLAAVDLRDGDGTEIEAEKPNENVASPVVSDATPHQRVLEDFIAAIHSGGTPACDGREGRRSVELVERIYAAARLPRR
jgi:predicted dehydrogenase